MKDRFDPDDPEGLEGLHRVLESTANAEVAGDHPDPQDLALWIDGAGDGASRARVEEHLAGCAECRALVLDVSGSTSAVSHDASRPLLFSRIRAFRAAALAAVLVSALVSFRLLTVDPRLGAHGVGLWDRLTEDREVLAAASALLTEAPEGSTGSPTPRLDFGSFATDSEATRGYQPPARLLSPRWEAVPMGSAWRWVSEMEPVDLWVFDERERVVLHESFDPDRLRGDGRFWAYSPAAGLAPNRLYAWKVNVRDARGELWASEPVPFRTVDSVGSRCDTDDGAALSAAAECLRAGYFSRAERHLKRLPDSEVQRRWLERVANLRRLPASHEASAEAIGDP